MMIVMDKAYLFVPIHAGTDEERVIACSVLYMFEVVTREVCLLAIHGDPCVDAELNENEIEEVIRVASSLVNEALLS